jgi:hypothetical protein
MLFFRHQFSPRWVGCGCCPGWSAQSTSRSAGTYVKVEVQRGMCFVLCAVLTSTAAPVQPLRQDLSAVLRGVPEQRVGVPRGCM